MAVIKFRTPWANPEQNTEQFNFGDQLADEENAIDNFIEEDDDEEPRSYSGLIRVGAKGIAVVLVVLGVVALILYASKTRHFGSASYQQIAELNVQEDTKWMRLGNNIFSYSKNGANCITDEAEKVWSVSYEMQQPIISIAGEVAAVADYNGSVIHIVNSKQILGSVSTNLPIVSMAVSETGEVAAVLDDFDTTWIYLYSSDGSTIAYFKTTMDQSGYPVAISVSQNGELVCVSHLTVGTSEANSSIAFYNFGAVGQNHQENNVSGFNYDNEVFPYVDFMNDNSLAAVSDARIAFFKGKEIPQAGNNALYGRGEVRGVYGDDDHVGLLFSDRENGSKYTMVVYDTDGDLTGEFSFDMDYTDVQIYGDRVIINNSQNLLLYSIKGDLRYKGEFMTDISAIIPTKSSSGKYILITDKAIERMVLE